ncbi:MAG: nickel pincer cofactor biosynthesis protein LarB [Phycisphaerae bacterium]
MDRQQIEQLLSQVREGAVSVEQAIERLRHLPFESLEFATLDHHRALRCGFPEVIFCAGKSVEQVVQIFGKLAATGANVLATRAEPGVYQRISREFPGVEYSQLARTITLRQVQTAPSRGTIGVVSAGTSDTSVAEEARITAEIMGQRTRRFYDVGVAGLHRLLAHNRELGQMNVLVVVAGMEGALPSVVAGLVAVPVIAVPTSVGYGASFGGLAALLSMLNSCAAGVAVVNIDNGFAGGYVAAMINRLADAAQPQSGSSELPGRTASSR